MAAWNFFGARSVRELLKAGSSGSNARAFLPQGRALSERWHWLLGPDNAASSASPERLFTNSSPRKEHDAHSSLRTLQVPLFSKQDIARHSGPSFQNVLFYEKGLMAPLFGLGSQFLEETHAPTTSQALSSDVGHGTRFESEVVRQPSHHPLMSQQPKFSTLFERMSGTSPQTVSRPAILISFNSQSTRSDKAFHTQVGYSSLPSLVHSRHLSQDHRKVMGARPKAAQARTLRLVPSSVNTVVEPYKKPTPLPLWRRWLTLEGWRVRKDNVMSYVKTGYAIAQIKRAVPGYSMPQFFEDITRLYLDVNHALAKGDGYALRPLVTESTLAQMKQEVEARHKGGWHTVTWDLPNLKTMQRRTVHGRLVGIDPKDTSKAFAQVTVRLQSHQKFAAYDRMGKLLAGSPDQELLVEDHWVFERPLWLKDAQWRLCGRLTL